jgi:hypothetical protein
MNTLSSSAAQVVAKVILEPGAEEISQRAQDALLCVDFVHVEITALNASPEAFPRDTLDFLLRHADRIFGMIDCGPAGDAAYWENLITSMTFPKLKGGRWIVRLVASDPVSWGARIKHPGYLGPFELSGPIVTEDSAAA